MTDKDTCSVPHRQSPSCQKLVKKLESYRTIRYKGVFFLTVDFLDLQAKDVKKTAEYVAQLRRVGKGLGVFEFDRYISDGGAA